MSIPSNFKRAIITIGAMVAMVASGVGFGLAPASAVTVGQLEGSNFVLASPSCGTVKVSFDYVGGPDSWTIDRNPAEEGLQVASGSVSTSTGTVRDIVITGQPAGSNEYALYGSRGGMPAAPRVSVMVKACPIDPPPVDCQTGTTGLSGTSAVVNDTVVYTASLPKKACQDMTVANGDTYQVANTYDGTGKFDVSSVPQHFIPETRVDLVIKKGYKTVTEVRKLPVSCWWVQTDAYTGNKVDIVGPGGHNGQFLGGGLFKLSNQKCNITPVPSPEVMPAAPTSVDKCGISQDSYTVPSTTHVVYLVDDKVVVAGTYQATGTVKISARAERVEAGFTLKGVSSWTFVFSDKACAKPPVVVPPTTSPVVAPVTPTTVAPVIGPKVVTDYVASDSSSNSWIWLMVAGLGLLVMGFVLPRRKAQPSKL